MANKELAILITARNMAGGVLRGVRGDIKDIQSEAQRAGRNIGRNVGIGMAAAGLVIGTQVRAGLDSLVELEEANAQTAAAIASTGGAAGLSLPEIRDLSEALEKQTTIDDKLIQAGANVLLTFKKVNKDAFAPALELAMDLSTRLGTDLNSSVLMVGKALEDPIRGVTALRRAGVQLDDTQVDQIRNLVEQNDLYGAQQILLRELESQVGGSATALSEGAGGAQRRFSDAVEDMQMALAQGFLPLIEKVSGKVQDMVSDPQFMSRVEDFGRTLASGFDRVLEVVDQIPWDTVAGAMEITAGAVDGILGMFTSLPPWVQTAVITGWGLNKLSGGALGNIVGMLGSGLIKGVLGMNAGVVNINAGVVNGGGGGVPGGGKGGGKLPLLGLAGAAGIALALSGSDNQSILPGASQQEQLSTLRAAGLLTDAEFKRLWAQAYGGADIGEELRALQSKSDAIAESSATASSTANRWGEAQAAGFATMNQKQSEAVAATREQRGLLAQIRDKPIPVPHVTVINRVSINNFSRVQQSAQYAYSSLGGGI